jgi:hypothetical protein
LPWSTRAARLPEPQRDAIRAAFGLHGHGTPDRLIVALVDGRLDPRVSRRILAVRCDGCARVGSICARQP